MIEVIIKQWILAVISNISALICAKRSGGNKSLLDILEGKKIILTNLSARAPAYVYKLFLKVYFV